MMSLSIKKEIWPIAGSFNISRVSVTEAYVLVVELTDGEYVGRGESEPHESDVSYMDIVEQEIEAVRADIERGISREELDKLLPAGRARNAIDCALWDLEAKKSGKRAWELAGVAMDKPLVTAYTISLNSPEEMAEQTKKYSHRDLLKLKLGEGDCLAQVRAVREAAPNTRLIVDANEAWSFDMLCEMAEPMAELGVELIEQPMPAGQDDELIKYTGPVPLCADESCIDRSSLPHAKGRYAYVNIKLDKTGGLTEALALADAALEQGFKLMVGCMTGTSLAMAPAMIIGQMSEFCDLDGPLLLAKDREDCLKYEDSVVHIPEVNVWG